MGSNNGRHSGDGAEWERGRIIGYEIGNFTRGQITPGLRGDNEEQGFSRCDLQALEGVEQGSGKFKFLLLIGV